MVSWTSNTFVTAAKSVILTAKQKMVANDDCSHNHKVVSWPRLHHMYYALYGHSCNKYCFYLAKSQ